MAQKETGYTENVKACGDDELEARKKYTTDDDIPEALLEATTILTQGGVESTANSSDTKDFTEKNYKNNIPSLLVKEDDKSDAYFYCDSEYIDSEANLISAINSNNWNEIYRYATKRNYTQLRNISNLYKSKVEPELFLNLIFEENIQQHKSDCLTLRKWLEVNKVGLINNYMYSFLRSLTYESDDKEIKIQSTAFDELITSDPNRWETYLAKSLSNQKNKNESLEPLRIAQHLNEKQEIIFIWYMVLNNDNLELTLKYGNDGYNINQNNLFLILMAMVSEKYGKADDAKNFYNRIITSESEGSYLSKKSKKEIEDACFIATLVYKNKYATEVDTLRFIRDEYLSNIFGQRLVSIYYRYSPKLTKRINQNDRILTMIRIILNIVVFFFKKIRNIRTE